MSYRTLVEILGGVSLGGLGFTWSACCTGVSGCWMCECELISRLLPVSCVGINLHLPVDYWWLRTDAQLVIMSLCCLQLFFLTQGVFTHTHSNCSCLWVWVLIMKSECLRRTTFILMSTFTSWHRLTHVFTTLFSFFIWNMSVLFVLPLLRLCVYGRNGFTLRLSKVFTHRLYITCACVRFPVWEKWGNVSKYDETAEKTETAEYFPETVEMF